MKSGRIRGMKTACRGGRTTGDCRLTDTGSRTGLDGPNGGGPRDPFRGWQSRSDRIRGLRDAELPIPGRRTAFRLPSPLTGYAMLHPTCSPNTASMHALPENPASAGHVPSCPVVPRAVNRVTFDIPRESPFRCGGAGPMAAERPMKGHAL